MGGGIGSLPRSQWRRRLLSGPRWQGRFARPRQSLSPVLWLLGYPNQAEQWNEAALALAQELRHPCTLGYTLQGAAVLHQWQRNVQRTYELATTALRLATAQGAPYLVATSTVRLGWAMAMQGRVEEGITRISQGLAAWQAIGTPHLRAGFLALLAEAYGKASRYVEGLTALDEALNITKTTGGRRSGSELYGLKGELMWQRAIGQRTPRPACSTP
jgi:predicted ATPase